MRLDSQPDSPRCYHNCEVCVLRNGKGSRDGIEVPEERPARRVVTPEEAEEFPAVVSDFRFTTPEPVASGLDERKEGGRPSRSRRRRGGGRSGEERGAEKKTAGQPKKKDKPEKSRSSRRRGGKKPEGAVSPSTQQPKAQPTAADAPAKKPRHRGGRRHSRRGGGKTEA